LKTTIPRACLQILHFERPKKRLQDHHAVLEQIASYHPFVGQFDVAKAVKTYHQARLGSCLRKMLQRSITNILEHTEKDLAT